MFGLRFCITEQWKNNETKARNVVIDVERKVAEDLTNKKEHEGTSTIRDGSITQEELDKAIKKLRKGKSPGPDGITTDWLKDLDSQNRQFLLALLNERWASEKLPTEIVLHRFTKKGTQINKKITDRSVS